LVAAVLRPGNVSGACGAIGILTRQDYTRGVSFHVKT
jgi:hypothetical protein